MWGNAEPAAWPSIPQISIEDLNREIAEKEAKAATLAASNLLPPACPKKKPERRALDRYDIAAGRALWVRPGSPMGPVPEYPGPLEEADDMDIDLLPLLPPSPARASPPPPFKASLGLEDVEMPLIAENSTTEPARVLSTLLIDNHVRVEEEPDVSASSKSKGKNVAVSDEEGEREDVIMGNDNENLQRKIYLLQYHGREKLAVVGLNLLVEEVRNLEEEVALTLEVLRITLEGSKEELPKRKKLSRCKKKRLRQVKGDKGKEGSNIVQRNRQPLLNENPDRKESKLQGARRRKQINTAGFLLGRLGIQIPDVPIKTANELLDLVLDDIRGIPDDVLAQIQRGKKMSLVPRPTLEERIHELSLLERMQVIPLGDHGCSDRIPLENSLQEEHIEEDETPEGIEVEKEKATTDVEEETYDGRGGSLQ
ncbi:hypothetical protein C8J56DRAFT_895264 [Mycena floridula]|nr:hypothetical protein C8J56DRAFT_895264 [Mycena floridula]